MNTNRLRGLLLGLLALALATPAAAKLRVVASTTDLGSIAASVGGDQVEVAAIARPGRWDCMGLVRDETKTRRPGRIDAEIPPHRATYPRDRLPARARFLPRDGITEATG